MMRAAVVLVLGLAACQPAPGLIMPTGPRVAATIDMGIKDNHSAVVSTLSKAVHRARIQLGPYDTPAAFVTVLPSPPGPYEGNSLAVPVRFDFFSKDGACLAVRHDTGKAFVLPSVVCQAGG